MATKLSMLFRNTVVLTARSRSLPAAFRTARRFLSTWCVCSAMPPSTRLPVLGSSGICPAQYTTPLATMAWEYGPSALGAASVWTAFLLLDATAENSMKMGRNANTKAASDRWSRLRLHRSESRWPRYPCHRAHSHRLDPADGNVLQPGLLDRGAPNHYPRHPQALFAGLSRLLGGCSSAGRAP